MHFGQLQELYLDTCLLAEKGSLEALKHLPHLDVLAMSKCELTSAAVQGLEVSPTECGSEREGRVRVRVSRHICIGYLGLYQSIQLALFPSVAPLLLLRSLCAPVTPAHHCPKA